MINGKIKILESTPFITDNILQAVRKELKLRFNFSKAKIKAELINVIIEALSVCPEILSLRSGKLMLDFGLDFDPTQELIYAIANSVVVDFESLKYSMWQSKSINHSLLNIYIQPTDFQNLLSQDFAKVITNKGQELPWLQWLLLEGDSVIITSYRVQYGPFETSRSGGAIMVQKGLFKVDPAFSGDAENNFITRALKKYEERIKETIGKNL